MIAVLKHKPLLLDIMASGAEARLDTFDEATGRFITEPTGPIAPGAKPEDLGWIVTNQDIIYALATLFLEGPEHFRGKPEILDIIGRAGDAIRDFQDEDGKVEFIKPDGSKWGMTYMGWTNYAWLEAWALMRDDAAFDEARSARWEEGLTLAHDGQAKEIADPDHVHNIPTWKAMSCWRAGALMGRPDWQQAAEDYMARCVATQAPGGFWPEHGGPTTGYNRVYLHALGLYHIFSGDPSVLPAIEAATEFHQAFTYPDGSDIKVIDGRTKYSPSISVSALVAMTLTPRGRRYADYLLGLPRFPEAVQSPIGSHLASLYHHMQAGDEAAINLDESSFAKTYEDWAILTREGPWMGCLSAFVCPPTGSRWGQDRQQFLSLWHEDAGLVIGGGNSRNQPEWSSFVTSGRYIPDAGAIADGGVALDYADNRCRIALRFEGEAAVIEAAIESGSAVNHLTLPLKAGERVTCASGLSATTGDESVRWDARQMGEWIELSGFRMALPAGADFAWPSVPFNPYAIDGAAGHGSECAILSAPVEGEPTLWRIARV